MAGFGGRPGLPATFRQSGVAVALPALLLPGLIASEFPPTHTLPANLTLTSTRPARRGSSLTHWLPRCASPFLLLQFGDRSAAFQTIIPPCPCAHGAELLAAERCGSHAAGRCTFVFLSQAVGQRGDPGWRRPSIQEAQCERMHEQRTDAAGARRLRAAQHLPAPLPGAQLGPQLPHPHPRGWRWSGSLAQAVAGGLSLGVRQGRSERSCIVGRVQREGSPATLRRAMGRWETFGNLVSRASGLRCLPSHYDTCSPPRTELGTPLGRWV